MTQSAARRQVEGLVQAGLDRLIAILPARALRYLLTSISARTGVSLLEVGGAQGAILGAVADRFVLGNYWRGLDPSAAVLAYLASYFAAHAGGTLVDVGANIGLFTLPLAQNPQLSCKLFEPDPLNYRLLGWNLANNCRNPNVRTWQLALLDRSGTVALERSADNHGDHRVRLGAGAPWPDGELFHESARATVAVAAAALDDVLDAASLPSPVVVKIDAQGAEAHIVQGGAAVLARTEILVLEYWPYGLRRMGAPVAGLFQQLAAFQRGCVLEERDWMAAGTTIGAGSFRPIGDILGQLQRLYADPGSVAQVDVILCR